MQLVSQVARPAAVAALIAIAALALGARGASSQVDSILHVTRVANGNRVGLTLTNYGFFGNNFINRSPSMEFPLGTGHEHLVRGGLWIGAAATDDGGNFIGVTTAALDASQGSASPGHSEFTPAGNEIVVRSPSIFSPFYSPLAVSELDHVSSFSDRPARGPVVGGYENHRPLNLLVRQTSYSWGSAAYADYEDIVFHRFTITNLGSHPLAGVWVGFYSELASGPKNEYASWPPSSGGSLLGSWFRKKWLQYDADLRLIREHRCAGLPVPDGCQLGVTPYWAGVKLLTPPAGGQQVTLAAWGYQPGSQLRDQDVERYAIMSAGTIQDLSHPDLQPITGDPVELLALGPFPAIDPGDSIAVDFALLGGAEVADIQDAAHSAQAAYDANYQDLPTVAVSPEAPAAGGLAIRAVRPAGSSAFEVEFTLPRAAPARLEVFDLAGRRVASESWAGLAAGTHRRTIGGLGHSNLVFLRLAQSDRVATARAAIVH